MPPGPRASLEGACRAHVSAAADRVPTWHCPTASGEIAITWAQGPRVAARGKKGIRCVNTYLEVFSSHTLEVISVFQQTSLNTEGFTCGLERSLSMRSFGKIRRWRGLLSWTSATPPRSSCLQGGHLKSFGESSVFDITWGIPCQV